MGPDYYRSLSHELQSLKNRVRSFIEGRHWLTDGEWKESVLRSMLRRHLPRTVEVGRGFVITPEGASTQVDLLLYDATKPILFRDGDLVFVTPDAVRGAIEVKTKIDTRTELRDALSKLRNVSALVREAWVPDQFFGLFAYEDGPTPRTVLETIKEVVEIEERHKIDCVCLGSGQLVWSAFLDPLRRIEVGYEWRAYDLPDMAPAYFLHNVVEAMAPQSVNANKSIWFPADGKDSRRVDSIVWREPPTNDS